MYIRTIFMLGDFNIRTLALDTRTNIITGIVIRIMEGIVGFWRIT